MEVFLLHLFKMADKYVLRKMMENENRTIFIRQKDHS